MELSLKDRKVWLVGGALVALIIVGAGWLLFINPERSSAAQLRSDKAAADQQNQLTALRNAGLQKRSQALADLKTKLNTALAALPASSGLPAFTTEVNEVASATSVDLASIAVGGIVPAVAATPATTASTTATTAPAAPSGTATAGATAATGEYSIPVTIVCSGSLYELTNFVHGIETGARGAVVTSTLTTPSGTGRVASLDARSTMTMQLSIFSATLSADDLTQVVTLFKHN